MTNSGNSKRQAIYWVVGLLLGLVIGLSTVGGGAGLAVGVAIGVVLALALTAVGRRMEQKRNSGRG